VTVWGLGPGDCPTRPVVNCQPTPPWQLRPTNPTTYLREFHSLRILFFFFSFFFFSFELTLLGYAIAHQSRELRACRHISVQSPL